MPRDYAKSGSKSGSKKKSSGKATGPLWMLGGLAIGLFVAFLVYLYENRNENQDHIGDIIEQFSQTHNETVKQIEQKPVEQASKPEDERRFDFYYILPELDVAVPDAVINEASRSEKPLEPGDTYLIQAASFQSLEDADRLKAKLALEHSLEAHIQTVKINNKTWHRVRVGPFTSMRKLNKARNQIQKLGLHTIVLKDSR